MSTQVTPVLQVSQRELVKPEPLDKATHADAGPGDGRGPRRPQGGVECGAVRYTSPPGAGLQSSSGDVGLAVAIEVADFDIDPCGPRTPGIPAGIGKAGAIGESHPP